MFALHFMFESLGFVSMSLKLLEQRAGKPFTINLVCSHQGHQTSEAGVNGFVQDSLTKHLHYCHPWLCKVKRQSYTPKKNNFLPCQQFRKGLYD